MAWSAAALDAIFLVQTRNTADAIITFFLEFKFYDFDVYQISIQQKVK